MRAARAMSRSRNPDGGAQGEQERGIRLHPRSAVIEESPRQAATRSHDGALQKAAAGDEAKDPAGIERPPPLERS